MSTRPAILVLPAPARVLVTALVNVLAMTLVLPAFAADKSLGSFRDWSAMRFGANAELACMAFSQPTKSHGDYSSRGDAFIFITHRPADGERGRISLDTGYTYKPGSEVTVIVDDLRLTLRTKGSTAWVDSDDDARKLVQAMRAGRELVVEGTSNRGTATIDHYSLLGFTAALTAISSACR